jgi:hypothetical protein
MKEDIPVGETRLHAYVLLAALSSPAKQLS